MQFIKNIIFEIFVFNLITNPRIKTANQNINKKNNFKGKANFKGGSKARYLAEKSMNLGSKNIPIHSV